MSPNGHDHLPTTSRCQQCQARLAADQRYCVDCGARRGPLPAAIVDQFAVVLEQGVEPAGAITAGRGEGVAHPPDRPLMLSLPTPRAAAVAVLGMLGFGVVVGSFGGAGGPTLASAPVIVAMSKPAAQPTSNTGQAEAGTSTSAAITQSASAPPVSPAPVAQTVTAASPTVPGGSTPTRTSWAFRRSSTCSCSCCPSRASVRRCPRHRRIPISAMTSSNRAS